MLTAFMCRRLRWPELALTASLRDAISAVLAETIRPRTLPGGGPPVAKRGVRDACRLKNLPRCSASPLECETNRRGTVSAGTADEKALGIGARAGEAFMLY